MSFANPFVDLPLGSWFDTLLLDFGLAFTFFTALTYAVLGRHFAQRRPAIALAVTTALALSVGLVWWEAANDWSIRDLGPIAVGFALLVLGVTIFQAVRLVGGNWSGAGIALAVCLLLGWLAGMLQLVNTYILQTVIALSLLAGAVAYAVHWNQHRWTAAPLETERPGVWNDLRGVERDRQVADQISDRLARLRREADWLSGRPDLVNDSLLRVRELLPIEGWLTQRLAQLREKAYHFRAGHAARIHELRKELGNLPEPARRQVETELAARFAELKLDVRMERLDRAVAIAERRIRTLTCQAEACIQGHAFDRVPGVLDEALRLQAQTGRLLAIIERTEARMLKLATGIAQDVGTPGAEAG